MKTKIILIEDNLDLRESTAELLELSGFEVFTANDGLDGLKKIKLFQPDLILCDIMMPNLDGYGVLHILSLDEQLKNIPFIFLTAKAERTDFRHGMELGADDYIVKPFQEIELLKSIEIRLKKSKNNPTLSANSINKKEILLNQKALEFLDFENNSLKKRKLEISRKTQIYSEGDSPQRVYYLVSGRIKTFQLDESGKQFITKFVHPGEFFGFIDIFEEQNYRATAEAMEDAVVLSISAEEFLQELHSNFALEIHFRKILTQKLIQNERNMLSMAYSSLRIRTAKALIEIAENSEININQAFTIRLMREDLANKIGTSPESVIRTLSEFKKEGLLEISGSQITIKNLSKLIDLKY